MKSVALETNMKSTVARSPRSRAAVGRAADSPAAQKAGLAWPVRIFLVSLFLPWIWHIGPLALAPYRLVLLIMLVPNLVFWMTGKAGQVRFTDIALLLYCMWCALSLTVNQGIDAAIQPSGILLIETAGAYFMARCFIRSADDFRAAIWLLFLIIAIMLPFAILEAFSKHAILLNLFSTFMPVPPQVDYEPRWGLRRAQGVLEHPILWGVVCGSILSLTHLVLGYGESAGRRWLRTCIVVMTALTSLSAGPMTAVVAQALLISYNWALRAFVYRWHVLLGCFSTLWIAISAVSNRSVPNLYLSYFSFDKESAYYRILIWTYGSQSALDHPLFGVGFHRWARPQWMPPSIDMFWLIHAVFYGIPAALLMFLAFMVPVVRIGFSKAPDARVEQYKTGYMIAMCGFFLVGWTVHFWNATYLLFLFLLGSGFWMLEAAASETSGSSRSEPVPVGARRERTVSSPADGAVRRGGQGSRNSPARIGGDRGRSAKPGVSHTNEIG